jgi:hypothetical protein
VRSKRLVLAVDRSVVLVLCRRDKDHLGTEILESFGLRTLFAAAEKVEGGETVAFLMMDGLGMVGATSRILPESGEAC